LRHARRETVARIEAKQKDAQVAQTCDITDYAAVVKAVESFEKATEAGSTSW